MGKNKLPKGTRIQRLPTKIYEVSDEDRQRQQDFEDKMAENAYRAEEAQRRRQALQKAQEVKVIRDQQGMLSEMGPELARRPTGWNTIEREDGRRFRMPLYNPRDNVSPQQFIDSLDEEKPRFLDSVLDYLRD